MSSRGFLRFEMDSSRRAVESYWRLRMIDSATSDEDKVTPVYKLEEICELLRSSHFGIVKEISEFVMKRLDHKSPIVKQKALRLIKYAVGKSGADFRREMQRNSVAVRKLVHYKGQPDPLKGDALNKAVRATAQEAVSAIFSEGTSKPTVAPDLNKRIEGFGNTNFEMPSGGKKSFLSEVVGLGSASIKQGINTFAQGHMSKKNENGSFKSPNLHRSLNMENDSSSSYEPVKLQNQGSFGISKNVESGSWGQNSGVPSQDSTSGHVQAKTREEKLVETIVTSGGVRLQPTRDSLQVFLLEAAKLDAVALSLALEAKLQSPMWQIRMKAICVLEAILRKKDDEPFFVVASYYSENRDVVVSCSELPQSSLREKANRVLSLLNGGQSSGLVGSMGKPQAVVELPDLIDTGGPDFIADDSSKNPSDLNITNHSAVAPPLIDNLFGDNISMSAGASTTEQKNDDDPFADVSFHPGEEKEQGDDLFSGMTVGKKQVADSNRVPTNSNQPELFDMFGPTSQPKTEMQKTEDVNDLMASFSINENSKGKAPSSDTHEREGPSLQAPDNPMSGILGSQTPRLIPNPMFPVGAVQYNFPPGIMLNPAFASQPFNYAAMGNLLTQQQQFLSSMSNFQQFGYGHMNTQGNLSGDASGTYTGSPSALPDIFQSSLSNQAPASVMNSSKKEDTRAFDFISDHLAAARDPNRIS